MQKLHKVMQSLVSTIGTVKVDRITMLPKGNGGDNTVSRTVRFVEEMKGALGIDLPKLLETAAGERSKAD